MAENPYAAPRTRVEDAPTFLPDGDFIPEGRRVPAGNGWRWIADAWTFMGEQRWTFVGVFLLLFLLQLAAQLVPVLGPLALALFYPVLVGGFVLGCDAVRRGGRLEVGHLFAGFQRHTGKLAAVGGLVLAFVIVAGIIMAVVIGRSFVPMLAGGQPATPDEAMNLLLPMLLVMLVIMAVSIPLTMAILFAIPLIVLTDSDVIRAIKTSFVACLKNILPFLVWGLILFGLGILGFIPASIVAFALGPLAAIPLFLGWLLLAMVSMVSLYIAYRDVFHDT
jgi:uncharacterized membrane protein